MVICIPSDTWKGKYRFEIENTIRLFYTVGRWLFQIPTSYRAVYSTHIVARHGAHHTMRKCRVSRDSVHVIRNTIIGATEVFVQIIRERRRKHMIRSVRFIKGPCEKYDAPYGDKKRTTWYK